jgi:hypothetical protein
LAAASIQPLREVYPAFQSSTPAASLPLQQRVFLPSPPAAALCDCSAVTVNVPLAPSLVQDPSDRLMLVSRPAAVLTLQHPPPLFPELSTAGGAA